MSSDRTSTNTPEPVNDPDTPKKWLTRNLPEYIPPNKQARFLGLELHLLEEYLRGPRAPMLAVVEKNKWWITMTRWGISPQEFNAFLLMISARHGRKLILITQENPIAEAVWKIISEGKKGYVRTDKAAKIFDLKEEVFLSLLHGRSLWPGQEFLAVRGVREALKRYFPAGWKKHRDAFDAAAFARIGKRRNFPAIKQWREAAGEVFAQIEARTRESAATFVEDLPHDTYARLKKGEHAPRELYYRVANAIVKHHTLDRPGLKTTDAFLSGRYQSLLSLFPELTPAGQKILAAQGAAP